MSYLLDASVLLELARSRPDPGLLEWLAAAPSSALHMSVLTRGELRCAVEGLRTGPRKERLRLWLEHELAAWFEDRLLPVTAAVADRCAELAAETGRAIDVHRLLAATALAHGLRLVAREPRPFACPGLAVVNPWRSG